MKTIDAKYVERIIRSVSTKKSYDYFPIKLTMFLGGFFFVLISVAAIFTQRQDIDILELYIGIGFMLLCVYPIFKGVVRLVEKSLFVNACYHMLLGSWQFPFDYASKRPHTKKFYSNPAGLLLMAIALKADGYIDESETVLEKATMVIPEFADIYAASPDLNQEDVEHMIKEWKK